MPRSGCPPAWSTVLSTPSLSRMRAASGERYSPQIFGRGKPALSRSATDQPRSASRIAVAAPAGPAPTTTTSITFTAAPSQRHLHGRTFMAGPSWLDPHRTLAEQHRIVRHGHVEESRLLAKREHLGRRVGAQDRQRAVVPRHRVPGKDTGGRPDQAMRHAPAHEIVYQPADPRGGVDLSQVADRLLGLEVVERHRRDDDVHRPGA